MTDQALVDRMVRTMQLNTDRRVWTPGDMAAELGGGVTEAEALDGLLAAASAGTIAPPWQLWWENDVDDVMHVFRLKSVLWKQQQ